MKCKAISILSEIFPPLRFLTRECLGFQATTQWDASIYSASAPRIEANAAPAALAGHSPFFLPSWDGPRKSHKSEIFVAPFTYKRLYWH
jgi:hypothetical protein